MQLTSSQLKKTLKDVVYGTIQAISIPTNKDIATIKEMIMALRAEVQTLVDQVTASKSIEAASAAALSQLVTQSKANAEQIAALMAQVAAGGGALSPEDAAAIIQAATDLHDSAAALQTAVPAGIPPASGTPVIPPVIAP